MKHIRARCLFCDKPVELEITGFHVIDKTTGKEPDICEVALHEDWAKGLIYCDMEGFFIDEDGRLILADECGNYRYVPSDRYDVVWNFAQWIPDIAKEEDQ